MTVIVTPKAEVEIYTKADVDALLAGIQQAAGSPGINPMDYGAVGDDIADDRPALDLAFAAAKVSRRPLFLPGGKRFKCVVSAPWVWDFTDIRTEGFILAGEGRRKSVIRLAPNVSNGTKLWQWKADSDWYYVDVHDISIETQHEGDAFTLGRDDFADPLNFFTARNFSVYNGKISVADFSAITLNYLVNSHMDNCQANCFANGQGANYGVAIRHRQVRFMVHTNPSYGNASYCVRFQDGHNRDIEFVAGDYENGNYLWHVNGANCGNIRVRGGQHSLWGSYGAYAQNSNGKAIYFENPTTEQGPGMPSVFVHPTGAGAIKVKDLWA